MHRAQRQSVSELWHQNVPVEQPASIFALHRPECFLVAGEGAIAFSQTICAGLGAPFGAHRQTNGYFFGRGCRRSHLHAKPRSRSGNVGQCGGVPIASAAAQDVVWRRFQKVRRTSFVVAAATNQKAFESPGLQPRISLARLDSRDASWARPRSSGGLCLLAGDRHCRLGHGLRQRGGNGPRNASLAGADAPPP